MLRDDNSQQEKIESLTMLEREYTLMYKKFIRYVKIYLPESIEILLRLLFEVK